MLGVAKRVKARMLFTSTSEVYGDPKEHPQRETYWGNVNPIGPRACYDEAKRLGETLMYAYQKQQNVDVRVVRIFNTFGPRMHPNDGRVVPITTSTRLLPTNPAPPVANLTAPPLCRRALVLMTPRDAA
eukprot:gene15813-17377_t